MQDKCVLVSLLAVLDVTTPCRFRAEADLNTKWLQGLPNVRETSECFNSAQPERQTAAAILALARHDAASNSASSHVYSLPEGGRPEARAASNRALRRERAVAFTVFREVAAPKRALHPT